MNYILREKRNPMTKEERKDYMRKYYAEHREDMKEYQRKYNAEHKDEVRAKVNKWRAEHQEERQDYMRKYNAKNLNSIGVRKSNIREMSRKILEKCHSKLPGYEIHHCFGYEDAEKFIYIPRELHLKIHQFLRDNNIPARIDHFNSIRELISSYTGYTYIRT